MAFGAAKGTDPKFVTILMNVMEQTLAKMSSIKSTEEPQTKESEIVEYEGRMRCSGLEKFNASSFVSVINFYLSQGDLERHRPKGTLVLYVDLENAGKIFNNLGFGIPEDEDDASMMNACGQFCTLIGQEFKGELAGSGHAELVISTPNNYKNTIIEGVEYSSDQTTKQELSFFYFKRKAIVAELSLSNIPMKK